MYSPLFTACDCCAKVLEGKQGTAHMDFSHLIVKGVIGLYTPNREIKNNGRVIWSRRRDDTTEMHFCDETCLIGFMKAKKTLVEARNEGLGGGDTGDVWG